MWTPSKATGFVPKALESRMRASLPQMSGRRTRRKLWSRAPSAAMGNTTFRSGCADGFPTGYGPCTDAAHDVTHLVSTAGFCAREFCEHARTRRKTIVFMAGIKAWLFGRAVLEPHPERHAHHVLAGEVDMRVARHAGEVLVVVISDGCTGAAHR